MSALHILSLGIGLALAALPCASAADLWPDDVLGPDPTGKLDAVPVPDGPDPSTCRPYCVDGVPGGPDPEPCRPTC